MLWMVHIYIKNILYLFYNYTLGEKTEIKSNDYSLLAVDLRDINKLKEKLEEANIDYSLLLQIVIIIIWC